MNLEGFVQWGFRRVGTQMKALEPFLSLSGENITWYLFASHVSSEDGWMVSGDFQWDANGGKRNIGISALVKMQRHP